MKSKRQGDVLCIKLASNVALEKILGINEQEFTVVSDKTQKSVLALGEVTGHHHHIKPGKSILYEHPKTKERFLKVLALTTIDHEEHQSIPLDPGIYRINLQTQWDYSESLVKKVLD